MRLRLAAVLLAFAALAFGTVLVFRAFDQVSHSASDTLRPFFITMAPVWVVAVGGAAALLHRGQS
jgi:Na+-driven multidrug efflux pump